MTLDDSREAPKRLEPRHVTPQDVACGKAGLGGREGGSRPLGRLAFRTDFPPTRILSAPEEGLRVSGRPGTTMSKAPSDEGGKKSGSTRFRLPDAGRVPKPKPIAEPFPKAPILA